MGRIDYGGALLRRWWVLIVLGIVGAVAGALLVPGHVKTANTEKWKTSTLVGEAPSVGAAPVSGAGSRGATSVETNQILFYAHEGSVLSAAAAAAGLHESAAQLESAITVTKPVAKSGEVGVIKLSGVAHSPQQSAAFTNAFAAQLGDYLNNLASVHQKAELAAAQQHVAELQARMAGAKASTALINELDAALAQVQQLSATTAPSGYSVLQPASAGVATKVSGSSSGLPSGRLTGALVGLVVGAVLGAAVVLLIASADRRLRSVSGASAAFGYRVVAEIPAIARGAESATLASIRDESYRKLQIAVLLEPPDTSDALHHMTGTHTGNGVNGGNGGSGGRGSAGKAKVLLVVSPGTEPSRSSVVENLAAAFAGAGQRVLVTSTFDLPASAQDPAGLGTALATDVHGEVAASDVKACVEPSRVANVAILRLGRLIPSSGQLLARAPAILDASRQLADVVIVEAPPLLVFHDGEALTSVADVVVLVGECGYTGHAEAQRAGDLLKRISAPVLGVALTEVPVRAGDLRQARGTRAARTGQSAFSAGSAETAGTVASKAELR